MPFSQRNAILLRRFIVHFCFVLQSSSCLLSLQRYGKYNWANSDCGNWVRIAWWDIMHHHNPETIMSMQLLLHRLTLFSFCDFCFHFYLTKKQNNSPSLHLAMNCIGKTANPSLSTYYNLEEERHQGTSGSEWVGATLCMVKKKKHFYFFSTTNIQGRVNKFQCQSAVVQTNVLHLH